MAFGEVFIQGQQALKPVNQRFGNGQKLRMNTEFAIDETVG